MKEVSGKTALYPGSFDPLTNGHISLIHRACAVFDHIIIGVGENPDKKPLFSVEERVNLIADVFADDARISVASYSGLTVEFAAKKHAAAIIRGLRAVSDFEYEFQIALMNRRLKPAIQTVFLMTDYRWLYISSTMIKSTARAGGNITGLVPENVRNALMEKFFGKEWFKRERE